LPSASAESGCPWCSDNLQNKRDGPKSRLSIATDSVKADREPDAKLCRELSRNRYRGLVNSAKR
jgi:hypothetical protein